MPGYSVSTVEPPRGGIVCPHCKLVLRDAVQTTGDGHRLCESCYKEICSLPNRTCADCGISLGPEESFYPDRAVRRDVLQTNVRCSYHTSGCVWVGQLQNMEDHCRQCRYQPVCCPNEGCGQLLVPDELDKHIDEECPYRRVRCEHCGQQECANALKEHYSVCPKFPIECGQCQERVSRERLDHHQQHSCIYVLCLVGECRQKCHWCQFTGTVGEVKAHVHERQCRKQPKPFVGYAPKDEVTTVRPCLPYSAKAMSLLRFLSGLLTDVRKQACPVRKLLIEASCDLDDLEALIREESGEEGELLEIIHSIRADICQLRKDATVTPLAELLQKLQRTLEDHVQKVRHHMPRQRTAQLMPRQQTAQHTQEPGGTQPTPLVARGDRAALSSDWQPEHVVRLEWKMEKVEQLMALVNVHASPSELQLLASLASTHNGSLLWKIPDVPRRKRDAVDERITSIYSPPFYTGRNGYKMCIRAYLNGDGIGYKTHLSLFFVLMKGEYDPLLKWPFDCKVSLILVDQNHRRHIVQTFKPSEASSSFQRPRSDMNVASGCPQFAKLTVLDDKNYVKDDVMYVKCIVDKMW